MRLFSWSLTMMILLGGLLGPNFKEKEAGPDAVVYWENKDKSYIKSSAEKEDFMKHLDKKIDEYIEKNPQLSEKIKRELKVFQTVHRGMIKVQVLLLLGEPTKKVSVSELGADEKWVYILYQPYGETHLYFKDDTIIKILGFQTGNVL